MNRHKGKLLKGKNPPQWFRDQSDGCSVEPFRPATRLGASINAAARFTLRADFAIHACYRHDYGYYLTALQYPKGTEKFRGGRKDADVDLLKNWKILSRNKFLGWLYGRLYFRHVRMYGWVAMKDPKDLAMPPTLKDLQFIVGNHLHQPLTEQAEQVIDGWLREYAMAGA